LIILTDVKIIIAKKTHKVEPKLHTCPSKKHMLTHVGMSEHYFLTNALFGTVGPIFLDKFVSIAIRPLTQLKKKKKQNENINP